MDDTTPAVDDFGYLLMWASAVGPARILLTHTSSFYATMELVEFATQHELVTGAYILGRYVVAAPGDNSHQLYRRYFSDMMSAGFREGEAYALFHRL